MRDNQAIQLAHAQRPQAWQDRARTGLAHALAWPCIKQNIVALRLQKRRSTLPDIKR
jgi:hypothetical protein